MCRSWHSSTFAVIELTNGLNVCCIQVQHKWFVVQSFRSRKMFVDWWCTACNHGVCTWSSYTNCSWSLFRHASPNHKPSCGKSKNAGWVRDVIRMWHCRLCTQCLFFVRWCFRTPATLRINRKYNPNRSTKSIKTLNGFSRGVVSTPILVLSRVGT